MTCKIFFQTASPVTQIIRPNLPQSGIRDLPLGSKEIWSSSQKLSQLAEGNGHIRIDENSVHPILMKSIALRWIDAYTEGGERETLASFCRHRDDTIRLAAHDFRAALQDLNEGLTLARDEEIPKFYRDLITLMNESRFGRLLKKYHEKRDQMKNRLMPLEAALVAAEVSSAAETREIGNGVPAVLSHISHYESPEYLNIAIIPDPPYAIFSSDHRHYVNDVSVTVASQKAADWLYRRLLEIFGAAVSLHDSGRISVKINGMTISLYPKVDPTSLPGDKTFEWPQSNRLRDDVGEWLKKRKVTLDSLRKAEREELLVWLRDQKAWKAKDFQEFIGPDGMREYLGYGTTIPFGFDSEAEYYSFARVLLQRLAQDGVPTGRGRAKVLIPGIPLQSGDAIPVKVLIEGNPDPSIFNGWQKAFQPQERRSPTIEVGGKKIELSLSLRETPFVPSPEGAVFVST